jgi:hypothetical protein
VSPYKEFDEQDAQYPMLGTLDEMGLRELIVEAFLALAEQSGRTVEEEVTDCYESCLNVSLLASR